MAGAFRQRTNLLRPIESFSLEDGALVRRMDGGRETRWPLAELERRVKDVWADLVRRAQA